MQPADADGSYRLSRTPSSASAVLVALAGGVICACALATLLVRGLARRVAAIPSLLAKLGGDFRRAGALRFSQDFLGLEVRVGVVIVHSFLERLWSSASGGRASRAPHQPATHSASRATAHPSAESTAGGWVLALPFLRLLTKGGILPLELVVQLLQSTSLVIGQL